MVSNYLFNFLARMPSDRRKKTSPEAAFSVGNNHRWRLNQAICRVKHDVHLSVPPLHGTSYPHSRLDREKPKG